MFWRTHSLLICIKHNRDDASKDLLQCHTVNNKYNMTDLEINLGLYSERPVTNCLCHCTAICLAIWSSHNTLQKQPLVPTGSECESPKSGLNIMERWKIPGSLQIKLRPAASNSSELNYSCSTLYALYIWFWYDNFIFTYKKFKCYVHYRHNCLVL